LIELLRALQPHAPALDSQNDRAAASTLAREIQTLRAYAKLISADARHTQRLHLAALAEPPDWPLAPLVLLPLIRPLLADGHTLWSLALHSGGPSAELRLQALGPDAASTLDASQRAPVRALNERLRAVHGASAALSCQPGSALNLPSFTLRWPVPTAEPATTP
jgi:hypothetical protein